LILRIWQRSFLVGNALVKSSLEKLNDKKVVELNYSITKCRYFGGDEENGGQTTPIFSREKHRK